MRCAFTLSAAVVAQLLLHAHKSASVALYHPSHLTSDPFVLRRLPLVAPFLVAAYLLDAVDPDPRFGRLAAGDDEETSTKEGGGKRDPSQPAKPEATFSPPTFGQIKRVTTHEDL